MALISSSIQDVAALLQQNEIAAIPTETVYGLAGNAYNEIALNSQQIDSLKLIQIHFDSIFVKINQYTNKPIYHIGFTIYSPTDYYYTHCLKDVKKGLVLVHYLKSLQINP